VTVENTLAYYNVAVIISIQVPGKITKKFLTQGQSELEYFAVASLTFASKVRFIKNKSGTVTQLQPLLSSIRR
jgi:hypothetical protein